jgi:DNA-binding transcriptional MerR regulator
MDKGPDAFRTIREVAQELALPQHVLRFWETRFPQIKPVKRAGGRRYYRPDDVDLLRGIRDLLYGEGYTIRGVQRILKEDGIRFVQAVGRGEQSPGGAGEALAPAEAPDIEEEEPDEAQEAEADEETDEEAETEDADDEEAEEDAGEEESEEDEAGEDTQEEGEEEEEEGEEEEEADEGEEEEEDEEGEEEEEEEDAEASEDAEEGENDADEEEQEEQPPPPVRPRRAPAKPLPVVAAAHRSARPAVGHLSDRDRRRLLAALEELFECERVLGTLKEAAEEAAE